MAVVTALHCMACLGTAPVREPPRAPAAAPAAGPAGHEAAAVRALEPDHWGDW